METSQLKSYAPAARKDFIAAITAQAARLGITAKGNAEATLVGDLMMVEGQAYPKSLHPSRVRLTEQIKRDGFEATMETAAYTWFNRLVAIRYMELHNYLDHGYRVLSHPEGQPRPQILEQITDLELEGLDRQKAIELKLAGNKDEELYRLILIAQGNALHRSMPFLFERLGAVNELLLPVNLLHSDSLVRKLVESIDEAAWEQIEIIGWLYQFYISDKKDQVIGKVVKPEDIPAATQLFTPNWIVKYMVQNSLGAQWLATYPESPVRHQMEYYIEPAEQTPEVQAQLKAITPNHLNPEEITLIDPACGSGHILVEAYDLFKAIYLERGYRQRDVPQLILEKNLYGLDIDQRAAQLAGFALMMKGRADDRLLFKRDVKLNVMAFVNSTDFDPSVLVESRELKLSDFGLESEDLKAVKKLFEHATTFGSLIQVPEELARKIVSFHELLAHEVKDLEVEPEFRLLELLLRQTEALARRYDVVVANPPYMGSKYLTPLLKKKLKDDYSDYAKDLFSAFIDRDLAFSKPHGRLGFMSPFVWMFISSHEALRQRLIDRETISSLIQLEYSGFDGATVPICTFTLRSGHIGGEKGCYIRLSDFKGSINQAPKTLEAIHDRGCGWFYEVAQDEFKKIPGSPVAYWVSEGVRKLFADNDSLGNRFQAVVGLQTGDNDRFLRHWFEVSHSRIGFSCSNRDVALSSEKCWFPYNKGGVYRKWYGNHEYVVNWKADGGELQGFVGSVIRNSEYYFREAVSWSDVSSGPPAFRFFPSGFIHDTVAHSAFYRSSDNGSLLLGFANTKIFRYAANLINPTLHFHVGYFNKLPFVEPDSRDRERVLELVSKCVETSVEDFNCREGSWNFTQFPVLRERAYLPTIDQSFQSWGREVQTQVSKMVEWEEELNRIYIEASDLDGEFVSEISTDQITLGVNPHHRYSSELTEQKRWDRFRQDTMKELVSYAVGCIMGRYSLDEPGLIYAHSGNESFETSRYQKFPADADGIIPLTDLPWFEDDAAYRLEEFLSVAWPAEHLEENLTFLADNLDPKKGESSRETIRRYLCDKFFSDHCQVYKKRPIYWLFSSGKQKAFQALVYLHRYNEGTLARMRSEYVIPLQGKTAARLEQLTADIEAATSSAHRKEVDKERTKLEKQQVELITFDEKLRHYADQRIALDLDDGVKVNYGKFGDLLADVSKICGGKE